MPPGGAMATGGGGGSSGGSGKRACTWDAAYLCYLLLGAGTLIPWNALITAADYWEARYPVSVAGQRLPPPANRHAREQHFPLPATL